MLEEFILDQLEKLEIQKEELSANLNKLISEEQDESNAIAAIMDQEDIGMELFSPRSGSRNIKQRIEDIQKHIEQIRYQQAEIKDQLEIATEKANKYQGLLLEARIKDPVSDEEKDDLKKAELTADDNNQITLKLVDEDVTAQLRKEFNDELEKILRRVEDCYELSHRDRIKCKNELKNLRYYLKAVISKNKDAN